MTDIETLGTKVNSTIFQISAVAFDVKTGEVMETFNQIADISKNEIPLNVDGNTLQWWLKTNSDLFKELLLGGSQSSENVLINFHKWLCDLKVKFSDMYLWGNGILFDNNMICYQLESLGLEYPIFYRNDRDVRTIVELARQKLGVSEKELRKLHENKQLKEDIGDKNLQHHNAFDDVLYQVSLVSYCYNILMR